MPSESYMADRASAENLLDLVRAFMKTGGLDGFRQESAMILENVLNCSYTSIRAGLVSDPTPQQIEIAFRMAARRLSGAPIAHVLGVAHFYGFTFKLAPGILVPRQETETLVETALRLLNESKWTRPRVLDLYTGCGNVLLSIAANYRISEGLGIDRDPLAVDFASENLDNFKLTNIKFSIGDASGVLDRLDPSWHLVTANPPYIATSEIPTLQQEIAGHEKWSALDGGRDGLDQFRILADKARRIILPDGCLLAEIGKGQDVKVAKLFAAWSEVDFVKDLNGIPRVLKARP